MWALEVSEHQANFIRESVNKKANNFRRWRHGRQEKANSLSGLIRKIASWVQSKKMSNLCGNLAPQRLTQSIKWGGGKITSHEQGF